MKLSTRGIYALRILSQLATHYGESPLSVAELSRRENISVKYLEQIIATLKKRGLVVSTRGKKGGYTLRQAPEKITLGDVIRAVDGPLAPIPCASVTAPFVCTDGPYEYDTCWIRLLMLRVRDNISAILDRETLADMIQDAAASKRRI
jgi:Rrf2 family transcriptional regulator, cysteine metabolism repressor